MVFPKIKASSSSAAATDSVAIERHHATRPQPSLSKDTAVEALSPTATAEVRSSVNFVPRKRKRTILCATASMKNRRKTNIRGYDDGTTTTTSSSSNSRCPESARRASAQYEDKGPLSRLQLKRRRRPRSAIRTEYLGVSSVAFAPPLRRYLNSPQHGRCALRSTRPTSPTRRVHSIPEPQELWKESAPKITAGRTSQSTARREELQRRGTAAATPKPVGYDDTPWSPLTPSEEPQSFPERIEEEKGGNDAGVVRMHEPSEISLTTGLLTPVGPHWVESDSTPTSSIVDKQSPNADDIARCEAVSDPSTFQAGRCGADRSGLAHQPSMQENKRPSGVVKADIGNGDIGTCHNVDSGSCGKRSYDTTQDVQRTKMMPRSSRHRRRIPRRTAWDLLTGRRMERDRRKGSNDINLSPVCVVILF